MRAVAEQLSFFFAREEMLRNGDRVIAGVSGGADSVFLLRLLAYLAPQRGFLLRAVHVHHGLRETADRDMRFTEELCASLGVPCSTVRADVRALAAKTGMGLEEAGRTARRRAFEDAASGWEAEEEGQSAYPVAIALAHHMEDQAETVLFRLCRGTSLTGLAGMRAHSGRYIRPILPLTRAAIEETLIAEGAAWCTDETNDSDAYARNRIRRAVLPVLEETVNPQSARHIYELAGDAAEAERYLGHMTDEAYSRCLDGDRADAPALSVRALLKEDPYLCGRILMKAAALAGAARDVGKVHLDALRALAEMEEDGTKSLPLPGGVTAERAYGRIVFRRGDAPLPGLLPLSADGYAMRVFPFSGDMDSVPRGPYTKWFDYDKISASPAFRIRQRGDRIAVAEGVSKSLSRFMIDEKVPRQVRDLAVLPAHGRDILWVPGYRINADYRLSAATGNVLELRLAGAAQD